MEKIKENSEEYVIDVIQLLKALWKRAYLIILSGVLLAAIALSYTMFFVTPKYSASVLLYVNNRSISLGSTSVSISASEISAAQSLVDTYIVILNNRTTMEEVAERSGLDYTYGQILGMVSASAVAGTEVFRVSVTCENPYDAATIANCIADVLPERIADIIEGSSMRIVDSAVVNKGKVSPNVTRNTTFGFVLGCMIACAIIALLVLLDDTIHDDEYIRQNYDLPILARVPDLTQGKKNKRGYYRYSYRYGAEETRGDEK